MILVDIDTKARIVHIWTKGVRAENNTTDTEGNEHDEKGLFTGKGQSGEHSAEKPEKSIAKPAKSGKIKRRNRVINLPRQEFAEVQSAFMSDVTKEEREQEVLVKIYGDHYYTGILREDGTRDIVGKSKGKPRK